MTETGAAWRPRPAERPRQWRARWRRHLAVGGGRSRRRAALLAVLAALTSAVPLALPAAATGSSLSARAAALADRLDADQARAQQVALSYLAEQHTYAVASAEAQATRLAISRVNHHVASDAVRLRGAAVTAYVDADTSPGVSAFFNSSANDVASAQVYLSAVSSRLDNAVTTFEDARHRLGIVEVRESAAVHDAANALAATGAARASVLAEVVAEQHLLASVRGQLASAVAAAELARTRAAAARSAAAASPPSVTLAVATSTTTTTPTTKPPSPPPPATVNTSGSSGSPIPASLAGDFAGLRNCESGDRYSLDTGNGYYGAYQFSLGTWLSVGQHGLPSSAAPRVQDGAAYTLYQKSGWSPWPECAAILGL